ncbi:MAG: sodium-dependent transporter [Gemmatimonadetes bacterium]|nr:sodium-dependent transporter [Gemmatimonadota bacterium]MCY3943965.1 sodium-dependent transporter [Gemmatimonadota bacterium]
MNQRRDHWSSNTGLVLAATGSAIGLGNLWKFPFITWENEGGAFVLVYLVCIAAVGLPIMIAELLIGRRSQKSAVGALKEAVASKWPGGRWLGGAVGFWGVLAGFILLSYYTVIAGWSLFYFVKTVGWTFGGYPPGLAAGDVFGAQVSNAGLQLLLSLGFSLGTIAVVYFGVSRGIERIARIFLPILFGILLLMLVSALGMGGAGEALGYIFRPNFADLTMEAVLEALGHSFFTLSLGMGAMITYGSYISRRHSVVKASGAIVGLDTLIALIATVIMFSVIFSVAGMREQVSGSTVGMLFISLPELFYSEVPFGVVLGPLFYVLVALAALTSTISLLEVVSAYLIDQRGIARHKATIGAGAAIFVFTIFAALSFTGEGFLSTMTIFAGKEGWFSNADHFVSNWMLPTGGFFITLAAGWFMTRKDTMSELMDGSEPRWFRYGAWRFFIRWVAPIAVAAIIVFVIRGVDFS